MLFGKLKQSGTSWSIYRRHLHIILMGFAVFLATACVNDAKALSSREQLQKRIEGKIQAADISGKCEMLALEQFYEQRRWKPVWDEKRYKSLLENIRQLRDDGLDPDDFGLTELEAYQTVSRKEESYVDRELLATCAALESLYQLRYGKVAQSTLNPIWKFERPALDDELVVGMIRDAVESNRLDRAFNEARPALPTYAILRKELVKLREPSVTSPADNTPTDYASTDYASTDTAPAGLSVEEKINRIRVNMERMRWYLHDLPERFVIVDIAGFGIALVENGKSVWTSRVQVGKAYRQTPVFQSNITHVTLNPKWFMPPTIFKQDALPAIRKDITYLERNRIRIVGHDGKERDKATVDWNKPDDVFLIQDAGPGGALGQLAIRFPNGFAIFLHETPHNELFKKEQRDFSSGCVRVENIRDLAALLLNDSKRWSRAALESAINEGKTREVFLPEQVPILITYITVTIDKQGRVNYLPDIYQQDSAILYALDKR